MAAEQQAALVTAYTTAVARLRDRILTVVLGLFDGLGSWHDADRARFVATVVPFVAGAQRQVASLTDAYLATMRADMTGVPVRPGGVVPDLATLRGGVDPAEVYGRPFVDVWAELAKGADLSQATAAGRQRAWQLTTTDLQLAKTHTVAEVLAADEDVVGYRRVLTGAQSCGLCVVASTQRYHRAQLMPIHPGCDCGVAPIVGKDDPGQVLNAGLLEQAHAAIADRFGARSTTGRQGLDYRDLLITHEHGEIGPVLARRGDHFDGPSDLGGG
jgi:hypothetical protein